MRREVCEHNELIENDCEECEKQRKSESPLIDLLCVYAVHQGDDDRYSGKPAWYFDSKADAEMIASGRGWYGGKAPISNHKAILGADGNYYLLAKEQPIKLNVGPEDLAEQKEKALKKLTPAERRLLGISDA